MLVPVSSAREIGKCQWEVLEPEGMADAKCWWGVPADNSRGERGSFSETGSWGGIIRRFPTKGPGAV